MGVFRSRVEEDKALQLCRERKKFVKQALNGRCALAAAHVAYIHSLKSTGTALRKFVDPEAPVESSFFTSRSATPEPLGLTEKSLSQFSFSTPFSTHPIDAQVALSSLHSPLSSCGFQANHMGFSGSASKKVEEILHVPVVGTVVVSSGKPEHVLPILSEKPGTSSLDGPSLPPGTTPLDFFGLFHPIDHQFPSQEENYMNHAFEHMDDITRARDEEGIPQLENTEGKESYLGDEESESDTEFSEPSPERLIGTFENIHQGTDHDALNMPSTKSARSETELFEKEKNNSPGLLSFGGTSTGISFPADKSKMHSQERCVENKVTPKDFFSSLKEIEFLFTKASESGKEVPRMLEANKLNFRPILSGKKKKGSMVSSAFWKACFSCGEEPKPIPEEPAQTAIKYLTWHRTVSSHSSSSRNLLGDFAKDDIDDPSGNLNTCMTSGSHASTLDRLHAWERKLYDEVKASEMVRREYDLKCKVLRQLESKALSSHKVDKTRSVVKDLHSRIRVGIDRIDSISRTIEDLRDKELQPQLEELIAGLSRMWEVMLECHKLQFQIMSVARINRDVKFSIQSESRREITTHLENELYALSLSFEKWTVAQKLYIEAIDRWLLKCVSLPQKNLKRNRRMPPPSVRNYGPPPIYVTCNVWLENLKAAPAEEVADSIKNLAAETARFLPRQEKHHGKGGNEREATANANHGGEDTVSSFNGFHSSLLAFLCRLNGFAESSSVMYEKLNQAIDDSKRMYYLPKVADSSLGRKPDSKIAEWMHPSIA